jgi:spermidine synthase
MIPWKLVDTAQSPGNGDELCLYERDNEFSIKVGNYELMNSRVYGTEDALGRLGCEKITHNPRARVLIGGLGMGYTLRSALNELGMEAQVAVAELVPEVVRWNREMLSHLAGHPLDDKRVSVHEADVAQMIKTAKAGYNAILLDVDNGPHGLTISENDWLYGHDGLTAAFNALRPNGVLSVWSSGPEPAFAKRLRRANFDVEEVGLRAGREGKRGAHYTVYIAERS